MENQAPLPRPQEIALEKLSPFELRETLLKFATELEQATGQAMLNAGRGNPNFLAATPREAYFELGLFAADQARQAKSWSNHLVGMPIADGISDRFETWLNGRESTLGVRLLQDILQWARTYHDQPDALIYEFVDGILGEHYPTPPDILPGIAQIVSRYLEANMGQGFPASEIDLFATEGGTAAMCYIFDSLRVNGLLRPGDKVALMAPLFTPYIDIVSLPEYGFEQVLVEATGTFPDNTHSWQYPLPEIQKLRDPSIKVLVCINPTNPPSEKIHAQTLADIAQVIREDNPNLVVVSDDVYATFAPGFRSLASIVPDNTVLVYSFSKYFGATGWRLGVISTTKNTVLNKLLAQLPADEKQRLAQRYSSLSDNADQLTFHQRLVADSRDVALRHTAGLSTPQQVQMALFALFDLLDLQRDYRKDTIALIQKRLSDLLSGMGVELYADPDRVGYYLEIDLMQYAQQHFPPQFVQFLEKNYEPADILFRLAKQTGVVALNGAGFDGPPWSIRVSLANLADEAYLKIGRAIKKVASEYVEEWKAAQPPQTK